MRLGRRPPLAPEKTRRVAFAAMFGEDLPAPASTRDWTARETSRPVWDNDTIGDCTCVTIANNIVGVVKVAYGIDFDPTTQDVLSLYEKFGYDPTKVQPDGSNLTDQGAVFEDVLTYVLKNGFKGHHLIGSTSVDPTNITNIKRTIDWFGVACIGIQLPLAWQKAGVWSLGGFSEGDPDWAPGSWGGHEVCAQKYDENGVFVWTWGQLLYFTFDAIAKFCDEIDAPVWASWIKANDTPAGISLGALEQRANEIRAA